MPVPFPASGVLIYLLLKPRRSLRYAKDPLAIQNFAILAIIVVHLRFFLEVRFKSGHYLPAAVLDFPVQYYYHLRDLM